MSFESTIKLLWQAYKHNRKLTSEELGCIDDDLKEQVSKIFPEGIVRVKSLPSKLHKRLSLRSAIDCGTQAPGKSLKKLGFTLISETNAWTEKRLKQRLHELGLGKKKIIRQSDVKATQDKALLAGLGRLGKKVSGKYNISAGLEELGYTSVHQRTTKSIQEELRKIWPYEKVKSAYENRNPSTIMSLAEFRKKHNLLYASMKYLASSRASKCRSNNGSRSISSQINNVHPEFPCLYNLIANAVDSVNEQNLGKRLLDAFAKGVNIMPTALQNSEDPSERKLYAEIKRARYGPLGIKVETPSQTIQRLTGLRPKDYSCASPRKNSLLKEITENATKLVFLVTNLIDPSGEYFKNGFAGYFPSIHSIEEQVRIFKEDGSYLVSDFIVGSKRKKCVVEVKSGTTREHIKALPDKYCDWRSFEEGNSKIDGVVAILQTNQRIYRQMKPRLNEVNLKTVSGEKFMEYFSKAIEALSLSPNHAYVAEAVPGVHSLENIYKFHEEVVFRSHVVLRPNQRESLIHHNRTLKKLNKNLEKAIADTQLLNIQ